MVAVHPRDSRKEELVELCEKLVQDRRLIIVSNRGPVEHQLAANGQLHGRRGTGGVVMALNTLTQNIDFTWIASAMGEGDRAITESSEGASIKSPIPLAAWITSNACSPFALKTQSSE